MKSPLNVLFINIPPIVIDEDKVHSDSFTSLYVYPPIGVMSLMMRIYKKEYIEKIDLLDFTVFNYYELNPESNINDFIKCKIENALNNNSYDVVCISVMFSLSHEFFKKVVNAVHFFSNECIIICGGIHPTNSIEFIFNDVEHINYIIRGEGEIALNLLLLNIYNTIQYNTISGVISRDMYKNNKSTDFSISETPSKIDVNSKFYSELVNIDFYVNNTSLFSLSTTDINKKAFPIMASRGCPVRCTFCAARTVHGTLPRWRTFENIRDEILFLNNNYGVTKIYLMDDNFVPKNKTIKLFEMLENLQLQIDSLDIVIQNMSVNHTDFDIIDALVNAKIKYLPLAIETGSVEIQKKIKKFVNLDKALNLIEYAQKKGMDVRCFYIIGFPGESLSQINETIEFAKRAGANWSTFSCAVPFPGTEMYDEFVKLGYIKDSSEFWKASSIRDRVFDSGDITAEQLRKIAYEANLVVNFVNSPYIIKKEYLKGKIVFENFVSNIDFHIFAYDCLRKINIALGNIDEAQKYLNIMKLKIHSDSKAKDFMQYFYLLDKKTVDFILN
jgi:radical SAM superfamily enzyme YgiQ (UPF0313 family)